APTAAPAGQTAQEVLNALYATCQRLAAEKGFVRVHKRSLDDLEKWKTKIALALRKVAKQKQPVMLTAGQDAVVYAQPCQLLPACERACPISVELDEAALMTESFDRLMGRYYDSMVVRMFADVQRRIEFFENEIEGDTAQVAWFQQLSKDAREKEPPVILN